MNDNPMQSFEPVSQPGETQPSEAIVRFLRVSVASYEGLTPGHVLARMREALNDADAAFAEYEAKTTVTHAMRCASGALALLDSLDRYHRETHDGKALEMSLMPILVEREGLTGDVPS
jgi:hypothetical protein